MGDDFTIADISLLGWVRSLTAFYAAGDLVRYEELRHVPAWLARARPPGGPAWAPHPRASRRLSSGAVAHSPAS